MTLRPISSTWHSVKKLVLFVNRYRFRQYWKICGRDKRRYTLLIKLRHVSINTPLWLNSGPSTIVTFSNIINRGLVMLPNPSSYPQSCDRLSKACLAPKYVGALISTAMYESFSKSLYWTSSLYVSSVFRRILGLSSMNSWMKNANYFKNMT